MSATTSLDPRERQNRSERSAEATQQSCELPEWANDPAASLERVMRSISRRTGPAYEHYHKLRQCLDQMFSLRREKSHLQSVIREAQRRLATVEADLRDCCATHDIYNANLPELKPEDLVDLNEAHEIVLAKMQMLLMNAQRRA